MTLRTKAHTEKTEQTKKPFRPEGPLAHQSMYYENPINTEVSGIILICKRTAQQAKLLSLIDLPEDDFKKLQEIISQYTLDEIAEGFELLAIGLDPKEDTSNEYIEKYHHGRFIQIAKDLNTFFLAITPKK